MPELSVLVSAYGPESAVRLEEEVVAITSGDCSDARGVDYLNGRISLRRGTVPESAEVVGAHSPEGTVALQEKTVVISSGNSDDARYVGHLDGCGAISGRAVAELPVFVLAHGPESTVQFYENAMRSTCGDLGNSGGDDLRGRILLCGVPCTELTVVVSTHCPKAAVRLQKKGVVESCSDLDDIRDIGNRTGVGFVIGDAGHFAQLAILVATHCQKAAVGLYEDAVVGDIGDDPVAQAEQEHTHRKEVSEESGTFIGK